jgi:hypothetical protein
MNHQLTKGSNKMSNFMDTQTLMDIMTTAIEGGCGYWMNDDDVVQNIQIHRADDLSVKEIQCETDVDGKGWVVQEITHTQIRKALTEMGKDAKLSEYWRKRANKFLFDKNMDYDAEDADTIVQYAMFKEIVFG